MLRHANIFNDTLKILKKNKTLNIGNLLDCMQNAYHNNPYRKNTIKYLCWDEQCCINFPILYLASIYLYIYAKKKNCNTFLFATRDCCQWIKIFKVLFPNENVHYFDCSRIMFETATNHHNSEYRKYVSNLFNKVEQTIFIDIHGTGKRAFFYFEKEFGKVPHCFILSISAAIRKKLPRITRKYMDNDKFIGLVNDTRGSPIEMLNYDTIGTLRSYDKYNGPIRDYIEYDTNLIKPYHLCIDHIIPKLKPPGDKLLHCDTRLLQDMIIGIFDIIDNRKPIISKYITHISSHKKNNMYKRNIINFFDNKKYLYNKNKNDINSNKKITTNVYNKKKSNNRNIKNKYYSDYGNGKQSFYTDYDNLSFYTDYIDVDKPSFYDVDKPSFYSDNNNNNNKKSNKYFDVHSRYHPNNKKYLEYIV